MTSTSMSPAMHPNLCSGVELRGGVGAPQGVAGWRRERTCTTAESTGLFTGPATVLTTAARVNAAAITKPSVKAYARPIDLVQVDEHPSAASGWRT
ncbi:hypothetical protein [Actinokineospora enzanensis]|uniref:hypothetical protein n=1 Tax=Actinokineospora enzanensis TaxID=155975 RepID=UPI0012EB4B04|nr:hypothetical protein [Actinokineospora enzanensis]